jgi:hypothetical protein
VAEVPVSAPGPWRIATRALRGGAIGAAIWGIVAWSLDYGFRQADEWSDTTTTDVTGVEVLGAGIIMGLRIAIPAALAASFLLPWALRLPRPWAVPLVGAALLCPLVLLGEWLVGDAEVTARLWPALFAVAFASAAVLVGGDRWTPAPPDRSAAAGPAAEPGRPPTGPVLTIEELRGDAERRRDG